MSMHQFRELGRASYGNPSVIKADFDILYKNALRRAGPDQPQMDIHVFMDAVELLAQKLYPFDPAKVSYEALRQFVDCAQAHLQTRSPSKK